MMLHSLLGYFDPGSGSILLQVVVGGFAGAALLFRYAWDHLRTRFSRSGFDPNRWRESFSEQELEVQLRRSGEISIHRLSGEIPIPR